MNNGWAFSAAFLGPLCAIGSSFTWAFATAIYTQTAGRLGALKTNLLRSLIVFPLFALCAGIFTGWQGFLAVAPWQLGWLMLSTLCSYALGDTVFYMAALRLGPPTALSIAAIYPLWSMLAGTLTLGEKPSAARILGTLLCISGVVWLVLQQREKQQPSEIRRKWISGLALGLLTSFFWAGNTYALRRGAVGESFLVVNALRYLLAILVLGGLQQFARLTKRRSAPSRVDSAPADTSIPPRFVLTVVFEAFFGSSIFVYAISHTDLSVAAPLCSLAPLFAVPIGLYLGTDRLHPRRLMAIVVTVCGVILLVR